MTLSDANRDEAAAGPAAGAETRPAASPHPRRRTRRDIPLTTPGVRLAAQRRRVTAADFDHDPLYDLARGPAPGSWQVATTSSGEIIGAVHRHGRTRWAPFTPTGTRLGARTFPSRAEAAFQIVIHHDSRTPRRRPRT